MEETNDDHIVDYLTREFTPDDPDETKAREAEEFRRTEKAEVIRELVGKGYSKAQVKLYAPALLKKRERDGIRTVEEARRPQRRVLGRPIGKRNPGGRGRSRR